MLETLYSTGMRRRELGRLELADLDRERGTVLIRSGKGRKDWQSTKLLKMTRELMPGIVETIKVTTEQASRRVARFAFELARAWGRRTLGVADLEAFYTYAGEDRFAGLAPMAPARAFGLRLHPSPRVALAALRVDTVVDLKRLVGVDLDYEVVGNSMLMVSASGTAVVVEAR